MIILVTIFILIIGYKFYIAINGRVRILSVTSLFLIFYLIFDIIGSVLLNYVQFPAEIESGFYNNPEIVFRIWLYTMFGLVGLLIGFAISHQVNSRNHSIRQISNFALETPIKYSRYDFSNSNFRFCLFFLLTGLIVLLLYRKQIGILPIESLANGLSAIELAVERSAATNDFSGKMYRYDIFMNTLPMLLFIVTFFISRNTKKKKWKILFILFFLFNTFYALSTLQKGPIIRLFLVYYIMHVLYKKNINKKLLLTIITISVPVIILMYMFFMGQSDRPIGMIMEGALHRIFIGAIAPFYWYIKYFDSHDLLWGASFPNPGGLLPFTSVRLTVLMMNYGFDTGDVVGSMPTVFLGEMYANFGVIGMIISSVVVGFLLQSLDNLFFRKFAKNKTVILCSIFVFLTNYFSKYTESSISNVFVDVNIYVVLLIYFIYNQRKKTYMR